MGSIQDNILRDGTSQNNRYASALDPRHVQVDGRDREYFLRYAAKLAEIIRYYDRSNLPFGTWTPFFPAESDLAEFLANADAIRNHPPPLALFLAFTRLMEILKTDINQLSEQHLDFYYKVVLRFRQQKAVPEKANVVFEIATTAAEPAILQEGTELLAGKDPGGNPIIFKTDKDLTVSKVSIRKKSSILLDERDQYRIYGAHQADSLDGLGAPLPKEAPYWHPFGESQVGKSPEERTMRDAKTGLAIASPMLLLREGERKIIITIRCQNYRLTAMHFEDLRINGVPDVVIGLLQPVAGVQFASAEALEQALVNSIGETNVTTYGSLIMSHVTQPFKLLADSTLENAFVAEATGEAGWVPLPDVVTVKQLETELRVEIKIADNIPAIVDFNPAVHKDAVGVSVPVLQIFLNHDNQKYLYDEFRGLRVVHLNIFVEAKGIRKMVLHTENGPANPGQPFLPFGAVPVTGSAFHFGNREIFSKKLSKLEIELSWANLPNDAQGFQDYYLGYPIVPSNGSFNASFSVLRNKRWVSAAVNQVILFRTKTVGVPAGDHPLLQDIYTITLPVPELDPGSLPDFQALDIDLRQGFGRLLLNPPDFGHTIFPRIYAEKAILKATTNPAETLPNVPYTPKINHFVVNYSSEISFQPGLSPTPSGDQIFHIEPFGLTPWNEDTTGALLPQFPAGTLYLGLSNVSPPQNVSFLFQMVDGSANPDVEVSRNDVTWSYFNGKSWKDFNDQAIQTDTTYGLQTSGILEFSLGRDISAEASFWPKGMHWIAARFSKDPSGASLVTAILPNAMVSTLAHETPEATSLNQPLAPGSIAKLLVSNPLIKSVSQPFSSFAGKPVEPEKDFYRRVSERLRHKNRGVTLWDYEHLVLEAFPSIYKVKCLSHTGRSIEAEPGSVTLLVIPDLRMRNQINPFEPKVSTVVRNQVKDYLTRLVSGFSKVYVDNPHYEQVLVEMSVGLMPGYDGSFYGRLLNEELKRFLSPWAFEEGKDIVFGGKVFKSSILSFVEQREYVDYVTDFRLYHLQRGPGIGDMRIREDTIETSQDFIVRPNTDGEEEPFEITASSPRSIIVTAPQHNITVLNPGEFVCAGTLEETGIGAMIIEVDFFVF